MNETKTTIVIEAEDFKELAFKVDIRLSGGSKRYFVGLDRETRYAIIYIKNDDGLLEYVDEIKY